MTTIGFDSWPEKPKQSDFGEKVGRKVIRFILVLGSA